MEMERATVAELAESIREELGLEVHLEEDAPGAGVYRFGKRMPVRLLRYCCDGGGVQFCSDSKIGPIPLTSETFVEDVLAAIGGYRDDYFAKEAAFRGRYLANREEIQKRIAAIFEELSKASGGESLETPEIEAEYVDQARPKDETPAVDREIAIDHIAQAEAEDHSPR